jgi:hypothetical protein
MAATAAEAGSIVAFGLMVGTIFGLLSIVMFGGGL